MSFSDTIFLFFLALILFGPKKLPEMARQAGRLLAELRRASNEFKSQIETEIAHLEVQKSEGEKNQAVLPASPPPPGAVASSSLNPTSGESMPPSPESPAQAAPTTEPASVSSTATAEVSLAPAEAGAEPNPSTSQASHV